MNNIKLPVFSLCPSVFLEQNDYCDHGKMICVKIRIVCCSRVIFELAEKIVFKLFSVCL